MYQQTTIPLDAGSPKTGVLGAQWRESVRFGFEGL